MPFFIVTAFRTNRIVGQWVIEAASTAAAETIACNRQSRNLADEYRAEPDTDHAFSAEENLTETDAMYTCPACGSSMLAWQRENHDRDVCHRQIR